MADQCLFCRIVRREIPVRVIHETEDTLAFADINPQAPFHALVIPKAHVGSLDEATDAAQVGRLALVGAELARREGFAASGYRSVINTNADAGQTVFHLHLHVLAGRRLDWPPG